MSLVSFKYFDLSGSSDTLLLLHHPCTCGSLGALGHAPHPPDLDQKLLRLTQDVSQ